MKTHKILLKILRKIKLVDLSRFCFYVVFLLLPWQVSLLLGVRDVFDAGFFNPYTSHFIYLEDVFLLLGLFLMVLAAIFTRRRRMPKLFYGDRRMLILLALFVGTFFVSILSAQEPLNTLFYALRALEFFVLYLVVVSGFLGGKKWLYFLLGGVMVAAFIGIFQYVFQQSLGLQFLGEPVLNNAMLGVAKVDLAGGAVLRAYGTFPHPNLLAAYLVIGLGLLFYILKGQRGLFISLLLTFVLALLLTFSRTAFLALVTGLFLFYAVAEVRINWRYLVLAVVVLLFVIVAFDLVAVLGQRFLFGDFGSIDERSLYLSISKNMMMDYPLGVGAGNFTILMQDYTGLKLMPWVIQPVHNFFFLLGNELGVQGIVVILALFGWLYYLLLKILRKNPDDLMTAILFALLSAIIVLGLFDHYLFSLYQGQALFWIVLMLIGFKSREIVDSH